MAQVSLDEARVKELLKQAVLELIQERRELFYDLLMEGLEDLALVNAIEAGEAGETVGRAEILRLVEQPAASDAIGGG